MAFDEKQVLTPVEKRIILNFLPNEDVVPKGLDPLFYHTLSYEAEVKMNEQVKEIRRKLEG